MKSPCSSSKQRGKETVSLDYHAKKIEAVNKEDMNLRMVLKASASTKEGVTVLSSIVADAAGQGKPSSMDTDDHREAQALLQGGTPVQADQVPTKDCSPLDLPLSRKSIFASPSNSLKRRRGTKQIYDSEPSEPGFEAEATKFDSMKSPKDENIKKLQGNTSLDEDKGGQKTDNPGITRASLNITEKKTENISTGMSTETKDEWNGSDARLRNPAVRGLPKRPITSAHKQGRGPTEVLGGKRSAPPEAKAEEVNDMATQRQDPDPPHRPSTAREAAPHPGPEKVAAEDNRERPRRENEARGNRKGDDDRDDGGTRSPPAPKEHPGTPLTKVKAAASAAEGVAVGQVSPPSGKLPPKRRSDPQDFLQLLPLSSPFDSPAQRLERRRLMHNFMFLVTGLSERSAPSKSALEKDIRLNGGRLLKDTKEASETQDSRTLLVIALPTSYKRVKYIWAVAKRVPILHPEWIRRSLCSGSVLDFEPFLLPLGYSFQFDMLIFDDTYLIEDEDSQRQKPFEGLRCGVALESGRAAREWARVLRAGGAAAALALAGPEEAEEYAKDDRTFRALRLDLLITDQCHFCPREKRGRDGPPPFFWRIIDRAARCGVAALALEWALQSAVHRERLRWDAPALAPRFLANSGTEVCYAVRTNEGRYEVGDTVILRIESVEKENKRTRIKRKLSSTPQEVYGKIRSFNVGEDPDKNTCVAEVYDSSAVFTRRKRRKKAKQEQSPKPEDFALRSTDKTITVPVNCIGNRFLLVDQETFLRRRFHKLLATSCGGAGGGRRGVDDHEGEEGGGGGMYYLAES